MILDDTDINAGLIQVNADKAAGFLKGMASSHRLLILCHMLGGRKSVTDLIKETGIAQTSMSQHLKKMREEGLVDYQRDHRTFYYFIKNKAVVDILNILYQEFCSDTGEKDHV
ncbi:MAG: ArsR/SmtB family transcription factor [Alphaproteobacteria bacterium]